MTPVNSDLPEASASAPKGALLVPALCRTLDVEIDAGLLAVRAEGDERIPLVISTEHAAYQAELGAVEILDHSPESVDLSRFERGIALMAVMRGMGFDHGHAGNAVQVGVVEQPALGPDRKLRGMARFSRSAVAQEVKQDVLDGIRRFVSPGYHIKRVRREVMEDGTPALRATKWMPYEVTFVPAPLDPSAGVGRSAGGAALPVEIENPELAQLPAPKAKEIPVSDNTTAATGQGAVMDQTGTRTMGSGGMAVTVGADRATENEWKDLAEVAKMHGLEPVFAKGMSDGQSPRDVRRAMNEAVADRLKNGPRLGNPVVLDEKEEKQYSLTRAILCSAGETEDDNCFEMEVSKSIGKALGKQSAKGFWMPTNMRSYLPAGWQTTPYAAIRAGLDSGTSTKGTELKFDTPGSFIDMLRNRSVLLRAGATMLSGLNGPVTFPKQNGAGTATWVAENSGSDVSDSNLLLTTVTATAKTLQSTTSYSRQLLRQAVIDVENLVRADLAAIHALALDLAGLNGLGASNQPLGIIQNTSVNSVTVGTHGGVPTYALLVDMETAVEEDNADIGGRAYITTPGIKGKLKKTEVFATTNGQPVWTGGQDGVVNGYPAFATNQIPSNLTKGTSTTVCHAIVYGVWSQLLIAEWGAMELITDPFRLKKQGMIEVTSFEMADIVTRHDVAFAVIKDAKTA
jgi:HK97 family phage major capsid protein